MFWSAFCLNDNKDTASCDNVEFVEEDNVKKKKNKRGKKGVVIKRGMFSVRKCEVLAVVLFVIRSVYGFECFEGGVKRET